jgi:hypothetical protein
MRSITMTYDPNVGRWISEDPIGFQAGDANLYRFVWNDPSNWVDPSGLSAGKWHHAYPVMLGGSDTTQPLFETTEAQHTAAEQVLKKHGYHNHNNLKKNDAARAKWAKLTDAERRAIIAESLRAAEVPDSVIKANMDKVMENSTPGKHTAGIKRVPPTQKNGGLITRAMMEEATKLAKLGSALGGLVIYGGVAYAYDKYVEAGEKGGMKMVAKVTLMEELRLAWNSGTLPNRSFVIKWYDRAVKVQFETNREGKWITATQIQIDEKGKITDIEGYLIKPGDLPLDFKPGNSLTAH